jgi:SAM-dependent methyltransferase
MRIADYGGTEAIGMNSVEKLLSSGHLKNYHMLDFDNGIDLRNPIKGKKFDMGLCMDLLEHTSNPFVVSKNIIDSLVPGAFLFVTVPFVWDLHAYPDDYWRFTPHGLAELFKEMETEVVYGIIEDEPFPTDPKRPLPVSLPYSRVVGIFRKK